MSNITNTAKTAIEITTEMRKSVPTKHIDERTGLNLTKNTVGCDRETYSCDKVDVTFHHITSNRRIVVEIYDKESYVSTFIEIGHQSYSRCKIIIDVDAHGHPISA